MRVDVIAMSSQNHWTHCHFDCSSFFLSFCLSVCRSALLFLCYTKCWAFRNVPCYSTNGRLTVVIIRSTRKWLGRTCNWLCNDAMIRCCFLNEYIGISGNVTQLTPRCLVHVPERGKSTTAASIGWACTTGQLHKININFIREMIQLMHCLYKLKFFGEELSFNCDVE